MRLFVVDDESHARRAIHHACRDVPDVGVVGEADSVEKAVPLIRSTRPDAIILDVVMPGEEGFRLFRDIEDLPPIVIYSGHAGRALEAFEAQAFDFLLKPLEPSRFAQVLARLQKAIDQRQATFGSRPIAEAGLPLRLTDHRGYRFVQPDQILAVEAEKDFSRLLLASGETTFVALSIGRLEERLPQPPFLRISRSLVTNCNRIDRVDVLDQGRGNIRFKNSVATLNVGRAALSTIKRAIGAA